ncbi:MAG: C40 family peptidase [Acidimicrobiales bacterium]|jgi:cell wall-associated NlpC family hydrolase
MSRPKSLALAVLVALLSLTVSSVALASPSKGRLTTARLLPVPGEPGLATTTTTLAPLPAKAARLLKRLLNTAAVVSDDDARAAALSERYDIKNYELAKVKLEVVRLERKVRVDDVRLSAAGVRLRQTAVDAYVSGELSAVNSSLLSDNEPYGEMAQVYSGIAIGQLRHALGLYEAAYRAADASRLLAMDNARRITTALAGIASLRAEAKALMKKATDGYESISKRLRRLVGAKEFARIVFRLPAGSPYKGPDLAGTGVSRVANAAHGLIAVLSAEKFLGVPYVFGGASKTGVDCSGLTMLAWASAGISLVHSATLQWEESVPVPLDQLEPGDLLFYHFAHDGPGAITHVVMYLGAGPFGLETVIQAAEPGTDVAVGRIDFDGFVSAGRP